MMRWLFVAALVAPAVALGATRTDVQKSYRAALAQMPVAEQYAQKSTASQDHFRTAVILLRATESAFAKKDYRAAFGLAEQAGTYARFTGKTLSLKELTAKYAPYVAAATQGVPAGRLLLGGKWKAYVSPDTIGFYAVAPRGPRLH